MKKFTPSPVVDPRLFLLATAAGASVANVYYAQPLLERLADAFQMDAAMAGMVVAATQVGSVLALLILLPLADRRERRGLLLLQFGLLALSLLWLAAARGSVSLLLGMLLVGLFGTACTQALITCTAAMATPAVRGRHVGTVQGGVFAGLLLARVVSGTVAAGLGWRAVYAGSAVLIAALGMLLWRCLPPMPVAQGRVHQRGVMASMWRLLCADATLRERGVLALLLFAGLNLFWSAGSLALSAPPLAWSTTGIGALGLAGLAGALLAGRVGRWMDHGHGRAVSAAALLLMLLAWLPLLQLPTSLGWLLLGIVLLDLGGQALHVSNQALVLRAAEPVHGQLIALYMLFYAVGSGMGAAAGPALQAHVGWTGVCSAGAGVALLACLWWGAARWHRAAAVRCR
ncbi:MFS transporter [Stenotrophomonas sp. CFBP8980]|uniref:MFS transporter n=1 Tax=Stenotrophomonas sp. CFBP8980 TaxID=3096523 RepID=UPI002A6A3DD7|nr:MFS transporter [Stenotrophomonas sp. CFBP8980]MDY1033044.1 MFS transporter [Stenotrophomonas sp. CFBP8980]